MDEVPFAWAGVGYGVGGWASALALGQSTPNVRSIKGVGLKTLKQRSPDAGADWLVWIGGLMQETPTYDKIEALTHDSSRYVERKDSLIRLCVPRPASPDDVRGLKPAEKLMADLREVVKKINALEYRAALRRPVPGEKR